MTLRPGDRVRCTALWSSFHGMRGRVTKVAPYLMIRIDLDSYDIRVGKKEVTLDNTWLDEPNMSVAE